MQHITIFRLKKNMSLITVILLSFILKLTSQQQQADSIEFSIRFLSADHQQATFELLDDNQTTLNYIINYELISKKKVGLISQEIRSNKTFLKQTNSDKLAQLQLASVNHLVEDTENVSGENYNSEQLRVIQAETWSDMHQFVIDNLDENRLYSVTFRILAKRAHLKRKKNANRSAPVSVSKQFSLSFKTTFNYELAAHEACNLFKQNNTSQIEYTPFANCYLNDCFKCKSNCYELKPSEENSTSDKPLLCEPCPCDQLKSTGACVYDKEYSIQCKQCVSPYTGAMCNQCENDGVDYYKNELGECVKCECNHNAWADNNDILSDIRNGNKRRKCQAVTGVCIDCMFNTTGKHCHQCRPGYHGDPLKRTCVLKTPSAAASSIETTSSIGLSLLNNTKHNFRPLALFSIYIFCILFLVLSVYVFIKFKYYQDATLKNGPYHPFVCFRFKPMWTRLNETRRDWTQRALSYFSLYWPSLYKHTPDTSVSTGAAASLNDDDRLNLAEHQMFDDSLYATSDDILSNSYTYKPTSSSGSDPFNDNDDILINTNKNPYRSLTIKS